jgi:MFS family permease
MKNDTESTSSAPSPDSAGDATPAVGRSSTMRSSIRALPAGIWALGLVSMLMDISSEIVHSLLPIYLSTVLGASMLTIGFIEGAAEATAMIVKVFSGTLSDYWGKRKPLVLFGYALSTLCKPLFPMASSVTMVAIARFMDRVGKGIRGAPRDALVADIAPPELRGAAFGLRQALDSTGAFLGPAFAILFMILLSNKIDAVLWIATIPAVLAVLLLMFAVKEPEDSARATNGRTALSWRSVGQLGASYWYVVALGAVFTLARFSEAFLVLRAQEIGMSMALVPSVMIVMNVVYAGAAYPAGSAADRVPPHRLLLIGLAVLIVADIVLATFSSVSATLAAVALWGLHMALTQGLLAKLVADTAPAQLRGTAYGVFNLVAGCAVLLASVIAGALWSMYGSTATFVAGAVFAAVTAIGIMAYRGRRI